MKNSPLFFTSLLVVLTACHPYTQEESQEKAPLMSAHSLLFDRLPYLSFVRKGMLYIFLNQEDEMAFVRIIPEMGDSLFWAYVFLTLTNQAFKL